MGALRCTLYTYVVAVRVSYATLAIGLGGGGCFFLSLFCEGGLKFVRTYACVCQNMHAGMLPHTHTALLCAGDRDSYRVARDTQS